MPSVKVNDVLINYIQINSESGKNGEDIVMVHGLATNLAFWYFSHAQEFSKHYRVTLYDLRGHGRSGITESGYTAGNMAIDLQLLLDYLGIKRAHFVAHSFGGVVALNLACLDPGRFTSLLLVDTHISAVRKLKNKMSWDFGLKIQQLLDRNGFEISAQDPFFGFKLLRKLAYVQMQKDVALSQEMEDLMSYLHWKNNKRAASRWLKLLETGQAEKELLGDDGLSFDSLRKLSFPIVALYGECSQSMLTGKQLLDVWPHADFRWFRGAGHFFLISRPVEFMENCRRFLNDTRIHGVPCRKGERNGRFFRSDRFFQRDGKWFFYTREAVETGPFDNLAEAKERLKLNVRVAVEI